MPGVLCVWADLPDDALDWYENEYIPDMREQNAIHTLHCERTETGFEGDPIGQLDSPWPLFAVYEVEEIRKATNSCYDKRNHPSDDMLAGPLAKARFDTRTYREMNRWQSDDWDGDASHITSVTALEFRIIPGKEEEVITWYKKYVAPTLTSSSDVLRLRLFEVDNATVLRGTSHETKEKVALHTYFALTEFATDDYPWDVVLEIAQNEQWRQYFESQTVVDWQISHYLVKRLYTAENGNGLAKDCDPSHLASGVGTSLESA